MLIPSSQKTSSMLYGQRGTSEMHHMKMMKIAACHPPTPNWSTNLFFCVSTLWKAHTSWKEGAIWQSCLSPKVMHWRSRADPYGNGTTRRWWCQDQERAKAVSALNDEGKFTGSSPGYLDTTCLQAQCAIIEDPWQRVSLDNYQVASVQQIFATLLV